jgi:hypothetical protein
MSAMSAGSVTSKDGATANLPTGRTNGAANGTGVTSGVAARTPTAGSPVAMVVMDIAAAPQSIQEWGMREENGIAAVGAASVYSTYHGPELLCIVSRMHCDLYHAEKCFTAAASG